MEKKVCSRCLLEKPISKFGTQYKNGKTYRRGVCTACRSLKQYHDDTGKPHVVERRKQRDSDKYYKQRFGLTKVEWQEIYDKKFEAQQGRCAICGTDVLPEMGHPSGETTKRFCLDHNHTTGAIRDLLCTHCNWGLGQFFDNPELLTKAAEYLIRHDQ